MAKLHIKRGSEGPKHDPYSYTEYTLINKNSRGGQYEIVFHIGLGVWMTINDHKIDGSEKLLFEIFKCFTGLTPERLEMKKEQAFWRKIPKKDREMVQNCMDADDELLGYAY